MYYYVVKEHVNLANAINLGATLCCRTYIELFATKFAEAHKNLNCSIEIDSNFSTTFILRHFDQCEVVTHSTEELMGRSLTDVLEQQNIRPLTKGSFADLFQELSKQIHTTHLLTTVNGNPVVPISLLPAEKRFMVRFLKAKGYEKVLICDGDGILREPLAEEVETPEISPSRKSRSSSKKSRSSSS